MSSGQKAFCQHTFGQHSLTKHCAEQMFVDCLSLRRMSIGQRPNMYRTSVNQLIGFIPKVLEPHCLKIFDKKLIQMSNMMGCFPFLIFK
jgi:hypothetical protein